MDLDFCQNTTIKFLSRCASPVHPLASPKRNPRPASRAERQATGQLKAGGQVGGALNAAGLGRPGGARLLGTASARSIGARGAGGGLIAGSHSRLCAGADLGGALSALAGRDGRAEGGGNDRTHILCSCVVEGFGIAHAISLGICLGCCDSIQERFLHLSLILALLLIVATLGHGRCVGRGQGSGGGVGRSGSGGVSHAGRGGGGDLDEDIRYGLGDGLRDSRSSSNGLTLAL